ncbi:MAG: hydantoinase B/oxoprolinase family protein, partial [Gammaproteobacteria bacterium]
MSAAQRDPVRIELLKNALTAIADEMAVTIVRTARSFVIKESLDFSTGLMDAEGALIAQGLCLPLHMGSFPPTMKAILRDYGQDLRPGDVYATNDPYLGGGTHLPDIYVFKPVFLGDELLGFAAAIGHQTDIGGRVAGGNACDNTEIYQEGVRIPPLRIVSRDKPDEVFFKMMRTNVRVPEKVLGDIMATVAACRRGEEGLCALARTYGAEALKGYMKDLVDYAEELTRAELRSLPDGSWAFEDFLDDDGFQEEPIRIRVTLTKQGDELTADFRGTSPQVKGSINMPYSFTCSATYACVRSVMDPSIPNNEGFFRPIKVRTEPGSFVHCTHPAPVAARGLGATRATDCLWGALAQMLPEKVFACGVQGDYGVTIAGYRPDGRPFVNLEFLYSGWGGRPDKDGIDGISSLAVNYANTPAEVVEVEQPLRIERYGFRPDSGGAGKHRGSLSIVRDYRLVGADEAVLQVRGDRQKFQPFGLHGGRPGAFAANAINPDGDNPKIPPGKFMTTMVEGDVFRATLAGGGGWGDPLERDPSRVLEDVLDEKVSAKCARDEYGVQIDTDTMQVNEEVTAELRARMSSTSAKGNGLGDGSGRPEPSVREPTQRTPGDVVVKIQDLHKYFGDLEVLKGISLEVHQG